MRKCPKCGEEVESGKKFCPECGEPISRPEPPTTELRKPEDKFEKAISATGRYKVKKLLGRGGMGVVYLAFDKELGIEVAIKSLPPELSADARSLNQLRQEAKLSMQLTHQNIVRLYDLKEAQDFRLLVMEYIPGFSLSDYLFYREKLKEEEAWEILKPVASALDYAHTQKVIHRDIKPSNILFKTKMSVEEVADYYQKEGKFPPDLEIKVADFGIARTVSDSMSRLSNMPVSGTLTYMSSEQIRGKRQTSATDIYSLGVVAYELLCGHPPFYQGEITYQIINEPPELIPEVKPEYMQAILKALSKNPEDRPKTCTEFIELPKKLSQEKDQWALMPSVSKPEAKPAPLPELQQPLSVPAFSAEAPKSSSRSPLWIALGITVLIVILGLSGFFGLKYSHSRKSKPKSLITHQPQAEPKKTLSISEPARISRQVQLLWKVGKEQPNSAHQGRVNVVAISPGQTLVASGAEDKTIKLWRISNGQLVNTLKGHSLGVSAIAFSPDGKTLASAGKAGKIILWQIPSGETIKSIDSGLGEVNALCFSPNGKLLASSSILSIKVWNMPKGDSYKKLSGSLMDTLALAFSQNNKILASGGIKNTIKLWDLDTGKELSTIKAGQILYNINSLAFSPGGSLLASAGTDKNITLWGIETGKKIRVLTGHQKAVKSIAFGSGGKILASASEDETIKIWQTSTGALLETISAHPLSAISLVGSYLASGGCPEGEGSSCKIGEVRLYKINW